MNQPLVALQRSFTISSNPLSRPLSLVNAGGKVANVDVAPHRDLTTVTMVLTRCWMRL